MNNTPDLPLFEYAGKQQDEPPEPPTEEEALPPAEKPRALPPPPSAVATSLPSRLSQMYGDYFLDYASYVILERAVPDIRDGLKPVQRRILHAMREIEDGRYNKVANLVGNTMQFHPHGNTSIIEAIVQLGQREFLIDTQGNWGNTLSGDRAAAERYIEARLTKFALEVVFNPKITEWVASYDGRRREPVAFPVKFPLLLVQGVEGIAVGLSCKILPHNFTELIDASIDILKGKSCNIYPDFPQGGIADVSEYNGGLRGGRVRVRARMSTAGKKNQLVITELPFSTTVPTLIASILAANEKGKIKILKIDDNTAEKAEIIINLAPGADAEKTEQALYAFTDCQVSIAPNSCVIDGDKPVFLSVNDLLIHSTVRTKDLLGQELAIRQRELESAWHFASLEKIFIEKRIYRDIEECRTWEAVLAAIRKGLKPYFPLLRREVTDEDLAKLTEIKIKRISKFDSAHADELILSIEREMAEVAENLANLNAYAIQYFRNLRKKYAANRQRRTELRHQSFELASAADLIETNEILYVNYTDGFAGISLKKDLEVGRCSLLEDYLVFRRDGSLFLTKVAAKTFIGKHALAVKLAKQVPDYFYNLLYQDGADGKTYAKRFQLGGLTRDKEYALIKNTPGARVLYWAAFATEEESNKDTLTLRFKKKPKLKKLEETVKFSAFAPKNRSAIGNVVTEKELAAVEAKPLLNIGDNWVETRL